MHVLMMSPPSCPLTGRHIRLICLIAVYAYFIYFLVTGIRESSSERSIFICSADESEATTISLKQCNGLNDYTTCGDGNICIESSCGYKLFNHIDVSVAGSSDPYEESGATSTISHVYILWFNAIYICIYICNNVSYILRFGIIIKTCSTGCYFYSQ